MRMHRREAGPQHPRSRRGNRNQVGFDTHFQKGHQVRTITAFTNDPNTPEAIMTMQGVVKQQVSATPVSTFPSGKVKQGAEVTKEVLVSDLTLRKDPFIVSDVNNANPAIKVEKATRTRR